MAPTVQEKIHVNLQKVYTEKLLPHPWEGVAPPVELPWECWILCLGSRERTVLGKSNLTIIVGLC